MTLRRFKLGLRLPILALLVAVVALGTVGTPLARIHAAPSGTLRVGWTAPTNLDPALFADAPDISIGSAIYNYLVTLDQKSNLVPSLAKSWKVSDDGTQYTISLQPGVKFRDGSDFTSADVKFTFARLQDPALKSGAAGLFSGVTSIETPDPLTVVFTLKSANAVFLDSLADYHTAILKDGTKDPAKELNGTGPFVADSIDTTDRAEFSANPNYWKPDEPKVAKLEMIFVKATADLVPALRGGQVDWVARLPIESYTELQGDSNVVSGTVTTNGFSNVRIRADRKPGSDPNFRKALRMAIDRDALNKAVFQGLAAAGRDTPVGPLYGSLIDTSLALPARDVEGAKALLTKAGYNGEAIDFAVPHGEEGSDELAQVLQAQWKEAGLNINLQVVDQSVYYGDDKSPLNWLNADLAVTFWASRPDPQIYLEQLYRSGAAYNEAHYANADLDKLIDLAAAETDLAKRAAIFSDIQKLLIDDGPSFIPYFQPLFYAQGKNISGIDIAPDPGLTSFATATVGS